ncbi:MAG TPA: zf-HC2 domain-containing protein, partial [Blastocatellia bacterium]|nr:zf-HC2 domain-containing protein [Blastocatellia bacterium]
MMNEWLKEGEKRMKRIDFGNRNCKRILDHMDSYISNELDSELSDEVSKHLEGCGDCSRELEARVRVKDRLQ